jgi:hypothetical protein
MAATAAAAAVTKSIVVPARRSMDAATVFMRIDMMIGCLLHTSRIIQTSLAVIDQAR